MEVQRAQPAFATGRVAAWVYLRGRFPAAHDRQRPQSRYRLVLHAGSRMARAQERVRALARPGELRSGRPAENAAAAWSGCGAGYGNRTRVNQLGRLTPDR